MMAATLTLCLTARELLVGEAGAPPIRVPVNAAGWRSAFDQAFSAARVHRPKGGLHARAQLGLTHSRVALLTVDHPHGLLDVPASSHEPLVHAWVRDMLHLRPQEQIIRWRALADPRSVLVSCTDLQIVEELHAACDGFGVRLQSCRPAVLEAPDSVRTLPRSDAAQDLIVTWTEAERSGTRERYGAVQLMRFRARQLHASWRGWLPATAPDSSAVDAMLARFAAQTGGAAAQRASMHWPAVTN